MPCGLEDVSRRRVEVVEGLERLFQLFRVAGMFLMVDGVQLCDISLYARAEYWRNGYGSEKELRVGVDIHF